MSPHKHPPYIEKSPKQEGLLMRVRVTPNASKNQIGEIHQDRLKIKLKAPPLEGKANVALEKFIQKETGLGRGEIKLVRGKQTRDKTLWIAYLPPTLPHDEPQ